MFDVIMKIVAAWKAKDYGTLVKYIGQVLQQLGEWYSGGTAPALDPGNGIHVFAAGTSGLAAVEAGLIAELDKAKNAKTQPEHIAGVSVDPAQVVAIVQLVISIINWWRGSKS